MAREKEKTTPKSGVLDRYRRKHAPSAAEAAADITRTAGIAGWPEAEAREAADLMVKASVTARAARCVCSARPWRSRNGGLLGVRHRPRS